MSTSGKEKVSLKYLYDAEREKNYIEIVGNPDSMKIIGDSIDHEMTSRYNEELSEMPFWKKWLL